MTGRLFCNNVRCRRALSNRMTCVTICSHAFCGDCAQLDNRTSVWMCPACDVKLKIPEDIAFPPLDLSDHERSLLLAGFPPDVVMHVASRAIEFWSYQMSQESMIKEMEMEDAKRKTILLQQDLDSTIDAAHREEKRLYELISLEHDRFGKEQLRHNDLVEKYQDKCAQFQKLQDMYDRLKKKTSQMF